jgi:hypothetical protein
MRQVTRQAVLLFALVAAPAVAQARPWENREPGYEPKPAHQLRNPLTTWPAEPDAPLAPIDEAKFRRRGCDLCNVTPDSATAALAPKIIAAAATAKSDPFTLAALAYFNTRCDAAYRSKKGASYGLLGIEPGMYRSPDAPDLPVDKADLTPKRLLDPDVNLAVGAALLEMWNTSHKEIDASFGGGLHRTGVAHFIWGDVVRSSGHEDLVLTIAPADDPELPRQQGRARPAPYVGINVVSPLEATPRVAPSGPGDDRSGGKRAHAGPRHRGLIGEPVRAIADGTVIFAGVNSPGKARMSGIPPEKIAATGTAAWASAGSTSASSTRRSRRRSSPAYMHLERYNVAEREEVKAGQIIGELGRTGVKVSPPHLHFEVRIGERHTNPLKTLGDTMIPPRRR